MFIKQGNFMGDNNGESPVLQTPEGQNYKVSYIVAFVWDLLDGKNSKDTIQTELERVGKIDTTEAPKIVDNVISELIKVNLVKPLETEAQG